MEFFALKNLDSRFRRVRAYAIIFASLCLAGLLYTVHASYRFAEHQREKIYVLDRGKSLLLALSQDQATNRPVEAREHVRRFHELFFTLSPDAEAIKENVERALALCDESGYSYYQDLLEKGYGACSPGACCSGCWWTRSRGTTACTRTRCATSGSR